MRRAPTFETFSAGLRVAAAGGVPSPVAVRVGSAEEYNGRGEVYGRIAEGFDLINQVAKPIVQEYQIGRGEAEAAADVDAGEARHRFPFTIRNRAYNETANRLVEAKISGAFAVEAQAAVMQADGDMELMQAGLAAARKAALAGATDSEIPGIEARITGQMMRIGVAAETRTIARAQEKAVERQREAAAASLKAAEKRLGLLVLNGASGGMVSEEIAATQAELAQYGPREAFTLGGVEYPEDDSRANILSAFDLAESLEKLDESTQRVAIQYQFEESRAPADYLRRFKANLLSGQTPFTASEGLRLISHMEGRIRARAAEARAARAREEARLENEASSAIAPYLALDKAGVYVAPPQEERDRILGLLAHDPKKSQAAAVLFATADARVATQGMSGPEVISYVTDLRAELADDVKNGDFDPVKAGVVADLQGEAKRLQAALKADEIGIDAALDAALDLRAFDPGFYDELSRRAGSNPDLLEMVATARESHRAIAEASSLSPAQRDAMVKQLRAQLYDLNEAGQTFGTEGVVLSGVLDNLEKFSNRVGELAAGSTMDLAEAYNVPVPEFTEEMGVVGVGQVIAERAAILGDLARREGSDGVAALRDGEAHAIGIALRAATSEDRAAFFSAIGSMDKASQERTLKQLGMAGDDLRRAGAIAAGGNLPAAAAMIEGGDVKGGDLSSSDSVMVRTQEVGSLLASGILAPSSLPDVDAAAQSYARSVAARDGGRPVSTDDLAAGYAVALGRQPDGTGGPQNAGSYGDTIAPAGWTGERIEAALEALTEDDLVRLARGRVVTAFGDFLSVEALRNSIETLQPIPGNPNVFVPLDENGAYFIRDDGKGEGMFTIDLRELK
jgi:hypothetical protein